MLAQHHARGAADALERFGIKNAGFIDGVKRNLFGRPGELFVEGPRAFGHGGSLSAKNVFWPATSGPGGTKWNWIPRANTLMMANSLRGALTPDEEGKRAPGVLGALGGMAGMAYGQHALGMLGAPLASGAGMALGRGLGHLLG